MGLRKEFANAPVAAMLWASLFVILLSYVGPALDDNGDEFGAAEDAIEQIKRENHIAEAGKKVCGENSAWQIEGNTLQCFNKRGARTTTAQVTQP